MIAEAGGSRTKLEKNLAEEDLTVKELMEDHKRRLTVQVYQQVKFLPAISVTRPMLLGYYEKNKSKYSKEKKVAMQLIAVLIEGLLPTDISSNPSPQEIARAQAAARDRIGQAEKLLDSGTDFTEVASKFTDIKRDTGGKLPLWPAGSLLQKKVENAAFSLQQGQRSSVIQVEPAKDASGRTTSYGGFYIVKAYEVREAQVTSFEDAQDDITRELKKQQLDELSAKFSERLYKESQIPETSEFIRTAVREAIRIYWKPEVGL